MRLCGLLLTTALFFGASAMSESNRTIDVLGESTVSVVPDYVRVRLSVTSTGHGAPQVQMQTVGKANKVVETLRGLNVSSLATDAITLFPNYNYDLSPPAVVGYTSAQGISYSLPPSLVGASLQRIVEDAASSIDSISSDLSEGKRNEAYGSALALAVADAESKADIIASELDARRGEAISVVSEDRIYVPSPVSYFSTVRAGAQVSPTYVPQSDDITASVRVVFHMV